jgi:hypothetical protein
MIVFSENDLDIIAKCKQKVVLVKSTSNGKRVAWVTFSPFEINRIEWTEKFALYASPCEARSGATILKMSDCIAQQQVNSTLERGWFSNFTPDNLPANTFKVTHNNADGKVLTFGLAQSVKVNNRSYYNSPINAVALAHGDSVMLSPIGKIEVYLEANVDDAQVLAENFSPLSQLTYSDEINELGLFYNSDIGMFLPR